ncbi:MAG: adenylate/guanylate cyclase domain-containing protein, partial [Bacteroidota bacterium]
FPDTIRIVLTGFADVEAIIGAINSGQVFRYITKPWDQTELRMTIENARRVSALQFRNKALLRDLRLKVEEQERTLRLFVKYVPEVIVQDSLARTGASLFDGELLHAVVLFCDLRGFTSLSERVAPKLVVGFLNDFYGVMTKIVKQHGGYVNQFVGDEIFATFGAPEGAANMEEQAVFAAIRMAKEMEDLGEKYEAQFGERIYAGFGINSGDVIAGNMGSEDRMAYSVTGDTVNTGKRIESLTKGHPNGILIRDSIYEKVAHLVVADRWEPIAVKGKEEKLQLFQVTGRK